MPKRILTALVLILIAAPALSDEFRIEQLPAREYGKKLPTIQLTTPGDATWMSAKPLWKGNNDTISAKLWMATTANALLFRVEVQDPIHNNDYQKRYLWRGDCIYLSIDARDDTAPSALINKIYGTDDAVYCFALCKDGPVASTVKHGQPLKLRKYPSKMIQSILRDEKKKTTTYNITIPFNEIGTAMGQSDSLAIACNVAHKDANGKDLIWGIINSNSNGSTVRKLHQIALPHLPGNFATISPKTTRLQHNKDHGQIVVAVQESTDATIVASFANHVKKINIPASAGLKRYTVTIPSSLVSAKDNTVNVKVISATGTMIAEQTISLLNPDVMMDRFTRRIKLLLSQQPHELAEIHLKSTLLLARASYNQLEIETRSDPHRSEIFMNTIERITKFMPDKKFDFAGHASKALPLVFAYISERDRSLQFYSLQLPYNWSPEKKYPLTVYLHGRGPSHPLEGLLTSFDNSHMDSLYRYVPIDEKNIPPSHRGFVLAPWARGNSGFQEAGETDVWESIKLVKKRFKIDSDRQYLTGFSMGGLGTWSLGARTPDMWAGININSAFFQWGDIQHDYLMDNITGLGVACWIGELEKGQVNCVNTFHKKLLARGIKSRLAIGPNLPHTLPYDHFQANVGYLMQFTRTTPDEFSFVCDTPKHAGRNGIKMRASDQINPNARPEFTCKIVGSTVKVNSKNTPGLTVDLTDTGLGIKGTAILFWNGKQIYKGTAKIISLGNGVPWWQ